MAKIAEVCTEMEVSSSEQRLVYEQITGSKG